MEGLVLHVGTRKCYLYDEDELFTFSTNVIPQPPPRQWVTHCRGGGGGITLHYGGSVYKIDEWDEKREGF